MACTFVLAHVATLLLLVVTALVGGELALARAPSIRGAERWVLAPSLGLFALGTLFSLLGLAGELTRPAIVATIVGIHVAGWGVWRRIAAISGLAGVAAARLRTLPRRRLGLWVVAGVVLFAPLFALALYPPSAFDETLYHLPMARAYAATGGLPFLPELRVPAFPQLAEVLSAALLLLAGDTATHFVALLANLLTAGVLAVWARSLFGASAAGLAAAVWLGSPLVVYLGGTGYVEPLLALAVTAACWSISRWRATGARAWLALGALFAASAADVKYLGLYFVAALALWVALSPAGAPRSEAPRRTRAGALALFLVLASAALLPCYGRIVALTGNPVFPFAPDLFGRSAWTPLSDATSPAADPALGRRALERDAGQLLTLPWDLVFRRQRVNQMPPSSPLVLFAVPLAALAGWRDRRLRPPLALASGYCLLFPLLPADARYLLPAWALGALGIAAGLWLLGDKLAGRLALRRQSLCALALLAFAPGWLYAGYRLTRLGPVPMTPAAREAHLARLLPAYPAVARLNTELGAGERAYLLYAEEMRYHVQGKVVGDWSGPDSYREIGPLLADPAALARRLRASGVRYLLIGKNRAPLPPRGGPAWQVNFELLHEDAAAALYGVRGAV